MEHAVADAGHDREERQHPITLARGKPEGRGGEQPQAAEQNRPRPHAIDHETRQRLHGARDDEEDGHQQAEFDIADRESLLEPREERRQKQLAEMADAVGHADQSDDRGVAADVAGWWAGAEGGGDAAHMTRW